MAKIGLKNFYYAVATEAANGSLTYAGATKPAKAISFNFDPSVSDATLYADDAIAEKDTSVNGGSCTMGIDKLDETTQAALLGHTIANSGEETSNTGDVAPYVGLGRVVTLMENGTLKYRAVFFPKVKFQEPSASNSTKGETTEFGTYEISGTVVPDASGNWRYKKTFTSEADAVSYLLSKMGSTTA